MKTILILAVLLAGCTSEKTHDVAYYLANPKERTAKIAECSNNPGEKAIEANCLNAQSAEFKASLRSNKMATF